MVTERRDVVVIGAGPAGMMLAAELTLAGTDVVVLERRPTPDLESARSRGLHARTIEVLDQRGIAGRFLEAGTPMQVQAFAGIPLPIADEPSRHPYGLALVQRRFEALLAAWIDELGVEVRRTTEVVAVTADDAGVDVTVGDGSVVRGRWVVGCDGGRSLVRKAAGIDFAGWDPTTCWIQAEVRMTEVPEFGLRGGGGIGPAEDGYVGVTLIEPQISGDEPTLDDLRAALVRVDGTDHGVHDPRFISRFTDMTRQATTYRAGRLLIAGDAAHVHAPLGGQGLNLGVQDAVNLGWKLARVVAGTSPVDLLDTYETERHPVGAAVLQNTMAQRALGGDDDRIGALRAVVAPLLALDEPRRHLAGVISGLGIRYDLATESTDDAHPLVGRRMPDLDLEAEGAGRVYDLLVDARPVLVSFAGAVPAEAEPWRDRVRMVTASTPGPWELPVVGPVPAPAAVLVRPDGYVAWAGGPGLVEALGRWFGTPA